MGVSIREVAELAGVSIATVSNVLNRPHLVAASTEQRVRDAIDRTGYVPNASARQLRVGTAPVVILIVPDIANPFFAELANGVEHAAAARDLAVLIASTEGDTDREQRYIRTTLEQRPTGVLITPAGASESALAPLADRVPAVLVDRHSDGAHCSVSIDDVRGGVEAIDHLASLGHRSVTWVVGPSTIPQCAERTAGVMSAASRIGIDVTTVDVPQLTAEHGRAVGSELLAGTLPTAVVCANDLLALGLEFALLQAGVDVPGDVSIVGFDAIEFGASAAVPLTSVARPGGALGQSALELLVEERLESDHRHHQVRFEPALTVRQSSAPPPRSSSPVTGG